MPTTENPREKIISARARIRNWIRSHAITPRIRRATFPTVKASNFPTFSKIVQSIIVRSAFTVDENFIPWTHEKLRIQTDAWCTFAHGIHLFVVANWVYIADIFAIKRRSSAYLFIARYSRRVVREAFGAFVFAAFVCAWFVFGAYMIFGAVERVWKHS